MASDPNSLYAGALDKIAEFRRLRSHPAFYIKRVPISAHRPEKARGSLYETHSGDHGTVQRPVIELNCLTTNL